MLSGNVIRCRFAYILYMFPDEFYDKLNKSPMTPPKAVFRGAWKILYLLMAVSFILILFSPNTINKIFAVFLFVVQLILNFNWGCVFFMYKQFKNALYICIALLIIVLLMTLVFFKQSFWAGLLQVPYCLWLILATYLNYYVVKENPQL